MIEHLQKKKNYRFSVPRIDETTVLSKAVALYEQLTGEKVTLQDLGKRWENHLILNYIRWRMMRDLNNNGYHAEIETDPMAALDWFKAINNEIKFKYPFLERAAGEQIAAKKAKLFGTKGIDLNHNAFRKNS